MLMRAVTVVAGVVLLIAQAAAQGPARMVVASNARLRERPSEEVPIVAVAPLGADLVELEISPDRGWVRVRTTDGREGWMLEALSRRVPPGQFLRVAEDVIRGRLQRKGDGFAAWMELEAFIDRARRDVADQETAARFALFRLEVIQATAIAGERYNRPVAPAFSAWLTTHALLSRRPRQFANAF